MSPASCRHKFIGSPICSICGWKLPGRYYPGPLADSRGGDTLPPPPHSANHASFAVRPDPQTVIVPCIVCDELAEHVAALPILECPECGSTWAREEWRTVDELVAFIREKLTADQDATRRRFYNPNSVLFQIAQAVDAFPLKGER